MKNLMLALCVIAFLLPVAGQAQTTRVLIVGDSWAEEQWDDDSHARVFGLNELSQYGIYGNSTTESGSTAFDWKQAGYFQLIDAALDNYPDIDTVQLTVGGNDFLNVWHTGMTPAEIETLTNAILFDLQLIINYILNRDPGIEILLSLYDYPNFRDTLDGLGGWFACEPRWQDMGQPTPLQLNLAAIGLIESIATIALSNPRIHYVNHFGLMQYTYGWPDDGIPPGTIALPGDINEPSPLEAMRKHQILWWFEDDCFHLTSDGYDIIVQNLITQYLSARMSGQALVVASGRTETYDGQPHAVTVQIQPPGLVYSVTYSGQVDAPIDAGVYEVVAAVDQPGWTGQTTVTLVIEPATQIIGFEVQGWVWNTEASIELQANASSGHSVEFSVISGPASVDGNLLVLDGDAGEVVIEATQPGSNNWQAATPVQRSVQIIEWTDVIFDDAFLLVN